MRRLRLRYLIFLLLLLSGFIPLLISSYLQVRQSREVFKTEETVKQMETASRQAEELSSILEGSRDLLRQLGQGLLAPPGLRSLKERLDAPWARSHLETFERQHSRSILSLWVRDATGWGRSFDTRELSAPVGDALDEVFARARETRRTQYRFIGLGEDAIPTVGVAVPLEPEGLDDLLVVVGLVQATLPESADLGDGTGGLMVIDRDGRKLWPQGETSGWERGILDSSIVRGFAQAQNVAGAEIRLQQDGKKMSMLARVVPVLETGWGVVVYQPSAVAFQGVEQIILTSVLASALLLVLSLVFAMVMARWLSRPIQRLTESSHEIVQGRFDRRVEAGWMGVEIADLASDFNRMSDYLQGYIQQLQEAAEVNRELFISTIRAFAAAIDAKDPYTRGHSERVARYSRAIARHLGLPQEMRQRVWVSAVLHDIGKIGVDDRILTKGGVLTPEEFEQMKLHPVIGAEIVEPVFQLREMIPGIRWHHEAWNGSGYPDGLKGEQIPLMARILAVADTFDAITTNRPYQAAATVEFALDRIKQLTGTKFDAKIVTAFLLAWEAGRITLDTAEEAEPPATFISLPATGLEEPTN